MPMQKPGILLVHKPRGVRSALCVSLLKRLGGGRFKTGHAGTLDSTAEGLLVLLTGKATRLSQYIMNFPKTYRVSVQFGIVTDTDDASGNILEKNPLPPGKKLEEMADRLLPSFLGTRMQRPPNISAVHVEGKRAHAIARSGDIPRIAEKTVSIYSFRRISSADSQGRISFEVLCSKGTYVRSLARDMGERMGVGGHVATLTRQSLGLWDLSQALPLQALEERNPAETEENMTWLASVCRSPLEVARHYSVFTCPDIASADRLRNGNAVPFRDLFRESWGVLSWKNSLVVHLSENLVFGSLKTSEEAEPLFVPRGRISLEEDPS